MVSFQTPISLNKVPEHVEKENLDQNLSNKRKVLYMEYAEEPVSNLIKKSKPALSLHSSGHFCRTEFQIETPLPLDWQQCLDIQSGKVHFYNTRTETRTSRDPREGSDSLELIERRSPYMRLDLELNLPCNEDSSEPINKLNTGMTSKSLEEESHDLLLNFGTNNENEKIVNIPTKKSSGPSWLAFEGDEKSEMVATVCKKCFMLVMLCKASPACPNCKFMHSTDQSTPYLKKSITQLLY